MWNSILSILKRTISAGIVALVLISSLSPTSPLQAEQPYLFIDGGTSAIERDPRSNRVVLHQKDRNISTTVDPGTAFAIWRAPVAFGGDSAIAMKIDPEFRLKQESEKSKIEINISRHDDKSLDARYGARYILRNGSSNYLGFAFMMDDRAYDAPIRWVLHFQVWQCCSTRTLPPLALQVLPGQDQAAKSLQFVLMKRTDNDAAVVNFTSQTGVRLPFLDRRDHVSLERGVWHRLIFHLVPSPTPAPQSATEQGKVELWINGRRALSYTGAWGYTSAAAAEVSSTYAVKLGIYRAAQRARQQVYFDDIRWGPTLESVDPDQ
jgi:hypothetical protein